MSIPEKIQEPRNVDLAAAGRGVWLVKVSRPEDELVLRYWKSWYVNRPLSSVFGTQQLWIVSYSQRESKDRYIYEPIFIIILWLYDQLLL